MKRTALVAVLTGLVTLLAGSMAGSPAGAAAPEVTHTKLALNLDHIDQCGFTVNSVVRGTDTFRVFTDGSGNQSYLDTAHVVSTLTNVDNDKVVHVDNAGRDAWSDVGVQNPDGTTTFTDTLTGRDVRIYTTHSSVLLKDVGYLAIVDTVDADGNLLSSELVERGPHAFAGDFDAFCAAITAAIG